MSRSPSILTSEFGEEMASLVSRSDVERAPRSAHVVAVVSWIAGALTLPIGFITNSLLLVGSSWIFSLFAITSEEVSRAL